MRDDISIDFTENMIIDFTGLENKPKYNVNSQKISLPDKFAKGWGREFPEFLKRILDENDVLSGTLRYVNCSQSDDKSKIVIPADAAQASVSVGRGRLYGTKISFDLKELTAPEVPDNDSYGWRYSCKGCPAGWFCMGRFRTGRRSGRKPYLSGCLHKTG